ncbi:MAG: helix-turn-helix domain-containing protein [Xenococcaceae cyanobacterium MO_207.B15]|nr:helix-turn-helix domain-containing protein [Xenococcaceae cyanobacterium MO_207.B15]
MIVGTTEAAKILNISTARLRVLLIQGRVEGAYKIGKMWLIPLFKDKPIIQKGKRGPAPRWCNPRKPAKTIIHVNTHKIKQNQKHHQKQAVITVKKGKTNQYGHEVEIPGGCRVVYSPDKPMYGARVWIETLFDVEVISFS